MRLRLYILCISFFGLSGIMQLNAQDLYQDLEKVRKYYADATEFQMEIEYKELQYSNNTVEEINSMPLKYARYNDVLLSEIGDKLSVQWQDTQVVIDQSQKLIQIAPSVNQGLMTSILPVDSLRALFKDYKYLETATGKKYTVRFKNEMASSLIEMILEITPNYKIKNLELKYLQPSEKKDVVKSLKIVYGELKFSIDPVFKKMMMPTGLYIGYNSLKIGNSTFDDFTVENYITRLQ